MADGLTLPDVPDTKTINYADQSIKTIDIVCQWHPALYRHPWGDKECRFPLNRKLRVVIKGAEVDIANLRQKEKW